jgi:hypothetical protein
LLVTWQSKRSPRPATNKAGHTPGYETFGDERIEPILKSHAAR